MINIKKPLERITIEDEFLRTHSQSEIAHRIMDLKKYAHDNTDVEVEIGDRILDTVGCNTETDFLKKYQQTLDEIGISRFFVENKEEDGKEYYDITVDVEPTSEEDNYQKITLTTKNCENMADFKINNQNAFNILSPEVSNLVLSYFEEKIQGKNNETSLNSDLEKEKEENITEQNSSVKSETLQKEMEKIDGKMRKVIVKQRNLKKQLEIISRIENGTLGSKKQKMESYTTRREKLLSEISEAQYRRKIQPKLDLENIWKEKEQRYYDEEKKLEQLDSRQNNAKFAFNSLTDILKNNDGFNDALMYATILPEDDNLKTPLLEALVAYKQNNYDSMKEPKEEIEEASEKIDSFLSNENLQTSLLEEETLMVYNEAIDNPTLDNLVTAIDSVLSLPNSASLNQLQDSMLKVLTNTKMEIPKSKESIEIDNKISTLKTSYANLIEEQKLKIEKNKANKIRIHNEIKECNKELKQLKEAKNEIQEKQEQGLLTVEDLDKKINEITQEQANQKQNKEDSEKVEEEFAFEIPEPEKKGNLRKKKDNSESVSKEYEEYYQKLKSIANGESIFQDESKNRTFKTQPAESIPDENKVEEKNEMVEPSMENTIVSELPINNLEEKPSENEEEQNDSEEDMENIELSEVPTPKQDSLSILTPIKAVKKASFNLLNKIRTLDFKKKQNEILEKLKNSKLASTAIILMATTIGFAGGVLATKMADKLENQLENNTSIENEMETNNPENFVGPIQQQNDEADNELTEVSATEAESEVKEMENKESDLEEEKEIKVNLESAIENTRNNIVSGTQNIYDDKYDAAKDENALNPEYIPSWKTSDAAAFYDEKSEVLTREQAEEAIARGEQVVVRYDNNNIPIGYAVVNNQTNDMNITK